MSRSNLIKVFSVVVLLMTVSLGFIASSDAVQPIPVLIDGIELSIAPEYGQPMIINDRTMVPLRAISEALGVKVDWDDVNKRVLITTNGDTSGNSDSVDTNIPIMGESVATSDQLRALATANNPDAPDLAELYLKIGREYGIRGDIAFCQAAKETNWWKFTGDVKPEQNNYCGLWATGTPNTGEEDLNGADPTRVWFVKDTHGAYFDTPATGVEAHIQHLYAYACNKPLPAGKKLLDPRFVKPVRGSAPNWVDLGGKWAPAKTYGLSIITDYFQKALKYDQGTQSTVAKTIRQLQQENELLKIENSQLKTQLQS